LNVAPVKEYYMTKIIDLDGDKLVYIYTEKEAAELLGISESTLKRIRYTSGIEYYRIGGRVFYSPDMLTAFIENCRNGGGE
jgi:excisionase family DNA binding protein